MQWAARQHRDSAVAVGLRCAVSQTGRLPRNDNRSGTPPLVRLKAACGPDDQGEPIIVVMLPGAWRGHSTGI
jgi:hypothetical protein